MPSELLHARAREAALKRHRKSDDPDVLAAIQERRYAAAEQAIRREAEADPPLTGSSIFSGVFSFMLLISAVG
jgi:hypothetical protein